MSKQQTLYFNNNKLYLITNELIEIHSSLIDYIEKNSHLFKIITTLKSDLSISKYKIQSNVDLETYINIPSPQISKPTELINYYGFYPKIVTQNDLSKLSQIELAVFGEGYSYYNTTKNRLYFLKKNSKHYYWDEGQNLVGMMGAKGEKGDKGENGLPGEKGDRGAQGPALKMDFVFDRPIEDLKMSQVALQTLGPNRFVFCTIDGKIYATKKNENDEIGISDDGWNFIGMQGEKGERGYPGEKGDRGENGKDAQIMNIDKYVFELPKHISQYPEGYSFLNINSGLVHIVVMDGNSKVLSNGLAISGPRGYKGEKGDRGEIGNQGIQGEIGPKGLPGSQGPPGEKGEQGDVGPAFHPNRIDKKLPQNFSQDELRKMGQGYSYFCVETGNLYFVLKENNSNHFFFSQGLKIKGERGIQGENGEKGDKGDKGDRGEKGERGDIGPIGAPGIKGDRGDKGERGATGIQGPAFTPDFRLPIEPKKLNHDQLEKYGDGTSILSTIDGKLYFINLINDHFVVSDGFEIVGVKGDRGEQGEVGPRGLQGQPGKSGDNYFNYNENRNLSYNRGGGIAIGKDAEIQGNELLRLGTKVNQITRMVLDGEEIILEYNSLLRQTIKNNVMYWENGEINFMNQLIIGEQKICMNVPLNISKIEANNLSINGEVSINTIKLLNSTIESKYFKISDQEFIMSEKIIFKIENDKIISIDPITFSKSIELEDGAICSKLIDKNQNTIWEYNTKHHFYGDILIEGSVFEMNGFKLENGKISDVSIDQLTIGQTIMRPNEILIQADKFKFVTPAITIDEKVLLTSDIHIDKNLLFGKNIIMNQNEWKIQNIRVQYENCEFFSIGKICFHHLQITEDELKIQGKRAVFDNTDILFRMSDKNWIRIKDNIMHFENTSLIINGDIQLGNLILSTDCIKSKSLQMMISDDKMELKNIKFIKNGGYIEVRENNVDFKDSNILLSGEININNNLISKNGVISIYDGIMNFENSRLQIGGFQANKDTIMTNQTTIKLENGNIFKNNMIIRDDKIDNHILNSSITLKNSIFQYSHENIDRFKLEKNEIKIDGKMIVNDGLEFYGNQMTMWNYKIEYQDGKLMINPSFMKIKTFKFVLENSIFLYKDENATLMIEGNIIYGESIEKKWKDCSFEWLDKSGNKLIDIKQNICHFTRCELLFERNKIDIKKGSLILDDSIITDSNKTFQISPGGWELNGLKLEANKGTQKKTGVICENIGGKELNRDMEITYTKSKINWIDDKNRNIFFMGDRLMQIHFPVVEYKNVDMQWKNKEGILFCRMSDTGMRFENTTAHFLNTQVNFEKNGFPILRIDGDEVRIQNVPLQLEDSFINYLYPRKNSQFLVKNDLMLLSHLDFEMKNSAFNWNQKFSLIGNKMKTSELDVEINGKMIWKNKKGHIEFDDRICVEDVSMKFLKGNSQFMEIYNGVVKVEGALMIKNGQFYNECFTLDPNNIKLEDCIFKAKKVNMYLENTNMTFDSQSHMQFGDSKIGEDRGLMIYVKGGNTFHIGEELRWETQGSTIKWGGYDKSGGKIIVSSDDWNMGQKDDFIYHNGRQLLRIYDEEAVKMDDKKLDKLWDKIKNKIKIGIDENSDIIEINGNKYVEQMMINMILIERIIELEKKLSKIH